MNEQPVRVPPSFPEGEVDLFIRSRVCSRCYGDLQKRFGQNRLYEVYCPACLDAWGWTTVSRHYAVQLGQRAIESLLDVKYDPDLADLFGQSKRTADQILADLGF